MNIEQRISEKTNIPDKRERIINISDIADDMFFEIKMMCKVEDQDAFLLSYIKQRIRVNLNQRDYYSVGNDDYVDLYQICDDELDKILSNDDTRIEKLTFARQRIDSMHNVLKGQVTLDEWLNSKDGIAK